MLEPISNRKDIDTLMEEGEKAFYSGAFTEAIRLYEEILKIEPSYERAKDHLSQAREYLERGDIPSMFLPHAVAMNFGKAQSAARVGRFREALKYIEEAENILQKTGITRWAEGLDFRLRVEMYLAAENTYQEGIVLLEKCEFEEALRKIKQASEVSGRPEHLEKFKEIEEIKEIFDEANALLTAGSYYSDGQLTSEANSVIERASKIALNLPCLNEIKQRLFLLKATEALKTEGYEGYEKILERMLVTDPLNTDIFFRYEWVRMRKIAQQRQDQKRDHYTRRVQELYKWANIWGWLSLIVAVILFGLALYVIFITINRDNPLTALISFLSFIPIFAAKLIYNQADTMNREATHIREQMHEEDESDLKKEQEEFKALKERIFVDKKRSKSKTLQKGQTKASLTTGG